MRNIKEKKINKFDEKISRLFQALSVCLESCENETTPTRTPSATSFSLFRYDLKDFITLSVCQKLLWKITFLSLLGEQGCNEQSPLLSLDTIARVCVPVPAPLPTPSQPTQATSSTSGSFITLTLAVPSSFAPVTVISAGSSLCAGASHGGSRFLNYEPDVSGRMGNAKGEGYREGLKEGVGNNALTSCPLSLLGVSHLLCSKSIG